MKHLHIIPLLIFGLLLGTLCFSSSTFATEKSAAAYILEANDPFMGDYSAMKKKRFIRFLVPYSRTFFFFDGATPKGLSYENVQEFEKYLNKREKTGTLKFHAIIIPTAREDLFVNLAKGLGDVAVGNITITKTRDILVDFSAPFATGVKEVLVTSKEHAAVENLETLAGKKVHVRKSSSYYEHLKQFNFSLAQKNKPEIVIETVDDHLEDEDLLEMINAGLLDRTIVDQHKASFWAKILDNITIHENAYTNDDGQIAWAFRENSPELKKVIDEYVKTNKKGTLMGNILLNRYLKNTKYITNSLQSKNIEKYNGLVPYFTRYGQKYNLDHLFLAAVAYQESRLDQATVSHVGAIGVMQILPSTAQDKNVGIPEIDKVDKNIQAGTKYLRFLADRYFPASEDIDAFNSTLFAIASYNAGPAKVARLRKEAAKEGLDPNKWFHNVEIIAAKRIGRETVQYVSNILKYYVGYTLLEDKMTQDKQ